jgi:hypothetical protein
MKAPAAGDGAAGFTAGAAAAPSLHGAAELAPRAFAGVIQLSANNFAFTAPTSGGGDMRVAGFPTAAAAAARYEQAMRAPQRPFASTPKHPGAMQAVPSQRAGEAERAPRLLAAQVTKPSASSPAAAPVKEDARYAGVSASKSRFMALGRTKKKSIVYLGIYDTPKEAADAHDAHVRRNSGRLPPVVNTPLHAGEIQAVPREKEGVTRQRAAGTAARGEAQPLRASHRAAGLPALALTPKKRKTTSEAPPEDTNAGAGGFASDDAAAAPAAPEPKRASILKAPPASLPHTPQQAPALPPAAPVPAAVAVAVADDNGDDLVAFLRGILPALTDLDRVVVTAAGSGVQMSQLLDAVRAAPHDGASMLQLVADILGIRHGGDKLTLMKALQSLA